MSPRPGVIVASVGAIGACVAGWILRDQTTDNDLTGEDVSGVDVRRGSGELGQRAVEVLSRHVGEKGQGKKGTPGYHRSPFIDKVNVGVHGDQPKLLGAAWCARAGRWAYEMAAKELGKPKPFAGVKSALSTVSSFRAKPFKSYQISKPKVGAVLLLGKQHLTLIAKVLGDRTVITVEGNHGDAVANVKRTIDPSKDTIVDVEAYILDAYRGAVAVGLKPGELDFLGAEIVYH